MMERSVTGPRNGETSLPNGGPRGRYDVGPYRVSTAEQGHSGLGLEAQRASVRAYVAAQGWTLVAEHEDIASGKDDRRLGFQAALARCRQLGAVLWRRGWTASRAGPTRCRSCWRKAWRSAPRTCQAPTS
jgi:hypothetical protein